MNQPKRLVPALLFVLALLSFFLPYATVYVFPLIAIEDNISGLANESLFIAVLANDTTGSADIDLRSFTVAKSSNDLQAPSYGKARANRKTGLVTYTPEEDFSGLDSFGYQVCDHFGFCSQTTVNVEITKVEIAKTDSTNSVLSTTGQASPEMKLNKTSTLSNTDTNTLQRLGNTNVYGRNVVFGTTLGAGLSYRNWLIIAAFISLILGVITCLARKYIAALLEGVAATTLLVAFYFSLENRWLQEPNGWFESPLATGFWVTVALAGLAALFSLISSFSLRRLTGIDIKEETPEDGATKAMRIVEEAETGGREPLGYMRLVIFFLAVCWSLFQLSIASWLTLDSAISRAIHLAFAITLVFIVFPIYKGIRSNHIPWYDYFLARAAVTTVMYLVVNYESIQLRYGIANQLDTILGVTFLLLLLEATRRSLGPALTIIGLVFLIYALSGPAGTLSFIRLPEIIAHNGYSLKRIISQMYITSEGVFGVALGVSTQFVFLFVLFGAMLDRAGAGKYFIDVANSFLGGLRGGPAKASVVASGMTGMVSGSSLANVVTTGTFTIPLMKRTGYPPHKAAATEVAVSTNGQIMPPVMGAAAFLIAEYVGIKYFDVVRAAFIPAIVSYIALFYIVHLEALKAGLKGLPRNELPPRLKTFIFGAHYLLPLFVLIWFLVVVRVSPGFAVMYAIVMLIMIMFLQEPVRAIERGEDIEPTIGRGFYNIINGLEHGARNMVGIAVAVATAGVVVGTVNLTGLGLRLTEIIENLSAIITKGVMFLVVPIITALNNLGQTIQPTIDLLHSWGLEFLADPIMSFFSTNPEAFNNLIQFSIVLLLTAIASLILGLGLPTTANYIVMATLTAPIIIGISSDFGYEIPLIAAHMFVFFFGILADDTPPVGLAAYAAAAIARTDPIKTGIQGFTYDIRTAILPFMFIFNTKLLLIGVEVQGWIGWLEVLHIFASAIVGMLAFAAATQGFALKRLNWAQRIVLLITAFMLIQPSWTSDIIGLVVMVTIYLWQLRKPYSL